MINFLIYSVYSLVYSAAKAEISHQVWILPSPNSGLTQAQKFRVAVGTQLVFCRSLPTSPQFTVLLLALPKLGKEEEQDKAWSQKDLP